MSMSILQVGGADDDADSPLLADDPDEFADAGLLNVRVVAVCMLWIWYNLQKRMM